MHTTPHWLSIFSHACHTCKGTSLIYVLGPVKTLLWSPAPFMNFKSEKFNAIVPDYMILCPLDEGRYMPDKGTYPGTISDKACDSYNCPYKMLETLCRKHFVGQFNLNHMLYLGCIIYYIKPPNGSHFLPPPLWRVPAMFFHLSKMTRLNFFEPLRDAFKICHPPKTKKNSVSKRPQR